MHILGLPTDIFNVYPAIVKFKTYQTRWEIANIYGDARKTEDNPQGPGCYLVMTGRGYDDIFRILDSRNYTFGDIFGCCERRHGQKCNCVMIWLMPLPWRSRTDLWNLGNWLSDCWQTIYAFSCQTKMKVIKEFLLLGRTWRIRWTGKSGNYAW